MATPGLSSLKLGFKAENICHQMGSKIIFGRSTKFFSTNIGAKNTSKQALKENFPKNVEEVQASQKAKFSPLRSRETNSARIASKVHQPSSVFSSQFMSDQKSYESKCNKVSHPADAHLGIYDCHNAVSLSSVVSGNVPNPYKMNGDKVPAQYNMQGGRDCQGDKYISGDLHDNHHTKNSSKTFKGRICGKRFLPLVVLNSTLNGNNNSSVQNLDSLLTRLSSSTKHSHIQSHRLPNNSFTSNVSTRSLFINKQSSAYYIENKMTSLYAQFHTFSKLLSSHQDDGNLNASKEEVKLTQRQKLKRAVKDYGATVIVFHVTISLASLGICYVVVSSGIDMTNIINSLGINLSNFGESAVTSADIVQDFASLNPIEDGQSTMADHSKVKSMAAGVSTFVIAYAVHKVFAPARIAITLLATPVIVRHLRKIGFLKTPKS